jgi:hypothetical protein
MMLNLLLVAPETLLDATRVYPVPVLLGFRLLNVAMPSWAETLSVPLRMAPVGCDPRRTMIVRADELTRFRSDRGS